MKTVSSKEFIRNFAKHADSMNNGGEMLITRKGQVLYFRELSNDMINSMPKDIPLKVSPKVMKKVVEEEEAEAKEAFDEHDRVKSELAKRMERKSENGFNPFSKEAQTRKFKKVQL